jgi:TRAF-interacting protein
MKLVCVVCTDNLNGSSRVCAIHCGHIFHFNCLAQWVSTSGQPTCPQCRASILQGIVNRLFLPDETTNHLDVTFVANENGQLKEEIAALIAEVRNVSIFFLVKTCHLII